MSTSRFEITRRYVPHMVNYDDKHEEAELRPVERRLDFDGALCALVLVDAWNTNEIGFERIDRVARERIVPVVKACREAGILVVHAPSPPVADKYPDRRFKPSRPEQSMFHREPDGWPAPEMMARSGPFAKYSLALDDPGARRAGTEEELYRNYFINPALGPEGDDVVIGDREELHALLKERRKYHLFFAGFASNGCMLERDYGIRCVSYLGYDSTLIRDGTTATEMAHTLGTLEQTRASTENMEFWFSSCTSADLVAGLRRMGQGTAKPGAASGSRVARQRRIIVNSDAGAVFDEESRSPDSFLSKRFKQTVGTQVDTYVYYAGDGWHPEEGRKPDPGLGDPRAVLVDAAHKAGMEIFASLRMNDIHCSSNGRVRPQKRERPELLIGEAFAFSPYPHLLEGEEPQYEAGYPLSVMQAFWAGFDYARPEVRELRRARVEELARNYDFDGIELDFFRHPLFFKPGEERENLEAMTDLVRNMRADLIRVGAERGRPCLLAARVPDTLEMSRRTGLDVQTWLEEGLLDMLMIAGGYMPFSPRIKELIDLAHLHDIPAYPSVDVDAWYSEEEKKFNKPAPHATALDFHLQPDRTRAIASNFRALGGDGVYLFNWYGLPAYGQVEHVPEQLALLNQLGEWETLRTTDKVFQPDNGCDKWMSYCGYATAPHSFPVRLVDGTPIEIFVGDDVGNAAGEGRLEALLLRIEVGNLHPSEQVGIRINGVAVPGNDMVRVNDEAIEATLAAPPLRQGSNEIVVLPGSGCIGRMSSEVRWVELSVCYT